MCVSIPFKRESSSEQWHDGKVGDWHFMFQFPSNGKVVPNVSTTGGLTSFRGMSFNSLQTGK